MSWESLSPLFSKPLAYWSVVNDFQILWNSVSRILFPFLGDTILAIKFTQLWQQSKIYLIFKKMRMFPLVIVPFKLLGLLLVIENSFPWSLICEATLGRVVGGRRVKTVLSWAVDEFVLEGR